MNTIRKAWTWCRDLGRTTLLIAGLIVLLGVGIGASVLVAHLGGNVAALALCQAVRGTITDAPSRYRAKEMSGKQRLKWALEMAHTSKTGHSVQSIVTKE